MATFHAKGFAVVPYELMDAAPINLRAHLFAVYLVLHRRGWGSAQGCWASVHTIQEDAGVGRKSVHAAVRWLLSEGWVTREERPGCTSVYRVRIEDPQPAPRPSRPRSKGTQVKNDPGQKRPTTQVKNDPGPRSKMTHEQEPTNKNPEQEALIPPTPLSIATPPPHPPLQGGAAGSDPFRIQQPDQPLTSPSPANRQHSTTTTALPPCAEPHRELLTAWWRRRCMNHPTAPRQLDSASITAIEAAAAAGVLEPFLRQAITDAPKTLGFQYRKRIAALSAPGDTTGFDEFRAAYLAVRRRATSQSIPKAITAYASVLANGTTAPQLLAALRANIRAQHEAEAHGGFAACLPDMFRWLRDGLYEAHVPRRGASGIGSGSTPPPNVRRVPDGPVDDPVALCDQLMAARRAAALAS